MGFPQRRPYQLWHAAGLVGGQHSCRFDTDHNAPVLIDEFHGVFLAVFFPYDTKNVPKKEEGIRQIPREPGGMMEFPKLDKQARRNGNET